MQKETKTTALIVLLTFAIIGLLSTIEINDQKHYTDSIEAMNNPYIIDAILSKQKDGFCLSPVEIEYIKADKWLTEEEENAIYEEDQKCDKDYIEPRKEVDL